MHNIIAAGLPQPTGPPAERSAVVHVPRSPRSGTCLIVSIGNETSERDLHYCMNTTACFWPSTHASSMDTTLDSPLTILAEATDVDAGERQGRLDGIPSRLSYCRHGMSARRRAASSRVRACTSVKLDRSPQCPGRRVRPCPVSQSAHQHRPCVERGGGRTGPEAVPSWTTCDRVRFLGAQACRFAKTDTSARRPVSGAAT